MKFLQINFSTELGEMATISAVLYANQNHPELKIDFPNWADRCKQILKKWRALSADLKAPFLQRARDNRSAIRTKKAQQVHKMTVDTIYKNIIQMKGTPKISNKFDENFSILFYLSLFFFIFYLFF